MVLVLCCLNVCVNNTPFFNSNAFFSTQPQCCPTFPGIELQMMLWVLLYTYKHHHTETLFMFTIFVPMSRPTSIYVVSM